MGRAIARRGGGRVQDDGKTTDVPDGNGHGRQVRLQEALRYLNSVSWAVVVLDLLGDASDGFPKGLGSLVSRSVL